MDSRRSDGDWKWLSARKILKPVECVSVGWLIQDDAECKVLAQSMAPDGDDVQTAGRKVIPTCCVVKVETLVEARCEAMAT